MTGARRNVALGVLLIFLANFLGGVSYPVQRWGLELLPAGTLTFARNAVAFVCLAAWLASRGGARARWTTPDLLRAFAVGTAAFALPLVLGVEGIERSTATNGSVLILLEPVTILLFSWLLLGERISGAQIVGVMIGVVGGLVLVLEDGLGALTEGGHFVGNVLLAASAVAWGLYTPLAKPLLERHDPVRVTCVTMFCSLLVLGPYAWTERAVWPEVWTAEHAWMLLVLGALISFAGTLMWVASLEHLQASWTAPFLLVQPLAGAGLAILWFRERPSANALIGATLIVTGLLCTLVSVQRRRARSA